MKCLITPFDEEGHRGSEKYSDMPGLIEGRRAGSEPTVASRTASQTLAEAQMLDGGAGCVLLEER